MSEGNLQKTPGVVEVTTRSKKTDREISFDRNFGKDLEEASGMFGAEVVHSIFVAQSIIRSQSASRNVLDNADSSGDDAIAAGVGWTPGVVRRGGGVSGHKAAFDTLATALEKGDMTEEQLVEKLRLMQEARKAAAAAADEDDMPTGEEA